MDDQEPRDCGRPISFPVFCEATGSTEPRECAIDNPSSGQGLEALCDVGTLGDLYVPVPDPHQGATQFGSRIAAVSKDVAQPWNLPFASSSTAGAP